MAFKARVLIPAGAVIAAILATACAPPPPPPPPPPPGSTTTTTTVVQPPATCPSAGTDGTPGPNSANPMSSWGINGTGYSVVAIGDIVYVGGTFSQAVSPTGQMVPRADLAAFCIKDGSLVSKFVANTNGEVWALTTDGTSLFAGGSFTSINGQATNRLVKLDRITGAVDTTFNPPAIPDIVYALGYRAANASVYAGGDFSIANNQGKKGASFDHTNGAVTGWNPNADARIESLEISGNEQTVYIGGSFDNVGGSAHNGLARTDAATGAVAAVQFGNNHGVPGRIDGRVFSISIAPDNVTPYVAIGPAKPGGTNGGNKFVGYNPTTGLETWVENGPDGDAQAIELINGVLYGGFHGGWNNDPQKRLEGLNPATGNVTGFAPNTGGVLGVRGMAQAGGRLFAVGDFSSMGSTNKLNGLAIFN